MAPPSKPGAIGAILLAAMAVGILMILAGSVLRFFLEGTPAAVPLQAVGVLLLGGSVAMGRTVDELPIIGGHKAAEGTRAWQVLKVLSVLLNMVALISVVLLIGELMLRTGLVERTFDLGDVATVSSSLSLVLAALVTATYLQSFRAHISQEEGILVGYTHSALVIGLVLSTLGALAMQVSRGTGDVASTDMAALVQLGATLVALDLFVIRTLPNAYVVLGGETSHYKGEAYFDRSKSVIAPILIAMALLLMGFMGFVLLGAGPTGFFQRVAGEPILLAGTLVLVVAIGAAFFLAARLAQKEDKPQLYQEKTKDRDQRGKQILLGSLSIAAPLLLLALFNALGASPIKIKEGAWVDVLAVALMVAVGPYGFYSAREHRRVRNLEERFPDFLRDIASSHRGGLTLNGSVTIAARGEYGALTPHIKRMADQMAWNVPFGEALTRFAEAVRTPLVRRAVYLVLEADRSGGSTADVLFAAARDAREIKNQENERRINLGLYTIVIYITFFVFLFVASVLYAQFVPQIIETAEASEGLGGGSPIGGGGAATLPEYRAFYYTAALVQGAGGGIVAGMMSHGKWNLGLQHAFAMVVISFVAFTFVLM